MISILFFYNIGIASATNIKWVEVSKTPVGIQYIKKDSLLKKDQGVIEITTKYLRIDNNKLNKIEENIYVMQINCETNKYKDISVNGNSILSAKWEDPNEDKLINDVILDSCKNV